MSDRPSNDQAAPADPAELVPLLTKHHDGLLAYLYSLVGNWQDAQDVLQKTSLVLWKKFDQFDPSTRFMDWATRIAFYEAKNFLRTSARDRHCFNDDLLEKLAVERVDDLKEQSPRLEALKNCLTKLKTGDRELLERVYQDRDAVETLARESDRAVQTIYNRLYRLRTSLADCVGRRLDEPEGELA